jgi:hypothetical protein
LGKPKDKHMNKYKLQVLFPAVTIDVEVTATADTTARTKAIRLGKKMAKSQVDAMIPKMMLLPPDGYFKLTGEDKVPF